MKVLALGFALLSGAFAGQTDARGNEQIVFRIEHAGNVLSNFTLTVKADGSAVYDVSYPPEIPKYSPYAATLGALPNTSVRMHVALTPGTTRRLFEQVRSTDGFRGGCSTKAKNIADTGKKTLTYTAGTGAVAACSFNYADDKTIAAMTSMLQGIGFTLDEGRKIEQKHRYDRLALDPETEYLVAEVKNGTATEVAVIAPALQALVDDPQVLERVRNRAATLLAQAAVAQ